MPELAERASHVRLLLYGPNPDTPYRTGGVAKWMRYLEQIAAEAELPYDPLYIDDARFAHLALPKRGRIISGVLRACGRILTLRDRDNVVLHVNTSLYPRIGYRDGPVMAFARRIDIPVVLQVHGGRLSEIESSRTSRAIWFRILDAATSIGVFPGPQFREFERSRFAGKVRAVYNVVPRTDAPAADQTRGARFLYLGGLTEAKRVVPLVDAFLEICSHGVSDATLTVAGEGPLEEAIRNRIASSCDYSGAITLEGFVTGARLERVMAACNVFVLPSRAEGFPLSFLECAERGMACIVTRNSAIPDLFEHGREFLGIETDDDTSLVDTLYRIASDAGLRARLGQAVQERVRATYTVEAAAPSYRQMYEELIAGLDTRR